MLCLSMCCEAKGMKDANWWTEIYEVAVFMRKGGRHQLTRKIYCDFLFNSSWHGYGSVSKHVIILMLIMPNAIYNSCQNNWFGQNNNPLTCYTYTVVGNKVHLQSTVQICAICVLLECFQFMTPHTFTTLHLSDSWCYWPVCDFFIHKT